MNKDDYENFVVYLAGVMSLYKQETTDFTARMWWRICSKYSLEQFMKAMDMHVSDSQQGRFPPMPADIVKHLEGTKTDHSLMAWGKVYDAMSSVGSYNDVCFDDGVIHRVIEDMGGWPKLCRTELKELSFIQNQFCKSYQAYAARGDVVFLPKLQGLSGPDNEQMYARRGLPVPPPCFVGDQQKCKQVMALGSANTTPITRIGQSIPDRLKLTTESAA